MRTLLLLASLALGEIPPGKVLMVIYPHHDDHNGHAGLIARMTAAGYTGYYVRVSNDEKDGRGRQWAANSMINYQETVAGTRELGIGEVISLDWRNDHMDSIPLHELRAQLVLLIRRYKPDVVMGHDPWAHYDRNPDHRKVSRAVADAVYLAAYSTAYPEHLQAGLQPHRVPHLYFKARTEYGKGHEPNVAVELNEEQVRRKAAAFWAHKNVRPDAPVARSIRQSLNAQGLTIPELEGLEDEEAARRLHLWSVERAAAEQGKQAGVKYAEPFYYLDEWRDVPGLRDYIAGSLKR